MDNFALTVFLNSCGATNATANVFLSPFSIAAAFALLHPAALGATAAELNAIVGLGSAAEALAYWQSLIATLQEEKTQPVKFRLANGVWVTNRCALREEYRKAVESLQSAVTPSNFAQDHAAITAEINKWVEGKTNDRIKDLIPAGAIDAQTLTVLVNALYFNGKWEHKFGSGATNQHGEFFVAAEERVTVAMMKTKANFGYKAASGGLAADYVRLPYQGGRFAMELLVPTAVDGVAGVLEALRASPTLLSTLRGAAASTIVEVYLPKFKVEAGGEITDLLRKSGLSNTFGDAPELGNMFEAPVPVSVSSCFHKVFMQVDEEGTEAAAATALILKRACVLPRPSTDPVVKVDRPSIVALTDLTTNSLLFVGLLRNPTK